jgi:hypothetical protein
MAIRVRWLMCLRRSVDAGGIPRPLVLLCPRVRVQLVLLLRPDRAHNPRNRWEHNPVMQFDLCKLCGFLTNEKNVKESSDTDYWKLSSYEYSEEGCFPYNCDAKDQINATDTTLQIITYRQLHLR